MIALPLNLEDVLEEGVDLECKRAGGRDGKGALPDSFWETLSAMANTVGGLILLGISQSGREFRVTGIEDEGKVLKAIWDGLHNPEKFSSVILRNQDVQVRSLESQRVIAVQVPRAQRGERPVQRWTESDDRHLPPWT